MEPSQAPFVEPVRLGRLPDDGDEDLDFIMFGWPRLGESEEESESGEPEQAGSGLDMVRLGFEARGVIVHADWRSSRLAGGLVPLRPIDHPQSALGSWWEGMSGAAVFCGDLLVAVQVFDPQPAAGIRLLGSPISRMVDGLEAKIVLATAGIGTTLDTVSAQPILASRAVRLGSPVRERKVAREDVRQRPTPFIVVFDKAPVRVQQEDPVQAARFVQAWFELSDKPRTEPAPKEGSPSVGNVTEQAT
jgi:hypothetical protein